MKKLITILTLITINCSIFTNAGFIGFSPETGSFLENCPFEIDIILDTEDFSANTVDFKFFAEGDFDIINIDVTNGIFPEYTQVKSSNARHPEFKNKKTIYFMGTTSSTIGFIGSGKVATLTILPKNNTHKVDLKRYMIPHYNGDDSNISVIAEDKVYDALNSVQNAEFTARKGICEIEHIGTNILQTESNINNSGTITVEELMKQNILINNITPLIEINKKFQQDSSNIKLQDISRVEQTTNKSFQDNIKTIRQKVILFINKIF